MRMSRGEYHMLTRRAAGLPNGSRSRGNSHANRGQVLESIINITNNSYLRHGVAVINKIPTEWIPIRGPKGDIVSAKVEQKSTVDYVGRYGMTPIAFDAKESHEVRMRWDRVEPHQEQFLDEWSKGGAGIGFILASFSEKDTFVIPWYEWRFRLEEYRAGGPASFKPEKIPDGWRVEKYDYLKTVEENRIYWRIA